MEFSSVVILGNGEFPNHPVPLKALNEAKTIICCDGAADELIKRGKLPSVIIGDLDSLSEETKKKFPELIIHDPDQETNDQTKAVNWALKNGFKDIVITGNTGKREDHTIANISLLADYGLNAKISCMTNSGIFTPVYSTTSFQSFIGQQISIFSLSKGTKITSGNLKYKLQDLILDKLWMGTLNESTGTVFTLEFEQGQIIVYQLYK
ncbi:MAG: thiamine diphosphokinase [Bacteroidales bacterium]